MRSAISLLALCLLAAQAQAGGPEIARDRAYALLELNGGLPTTKAANPLCTCRVCDCGPLCDCGPAAELAKVNCLELLRCKGATLEDYCLMRAQAIKRGIPLVVGVRCEPIVPTGWLSIRVEEFPYCKGPAQVIGVPHNGDLDRLDLPAASSVPGVKGAVQALEKSWTGAAAVPGIAAGQVYWSPPAWSPRSC